MKKVSVGIFSILILMSASGAAAMTSGDSMMATDTMMKDTMKATTTMSSDTMMKDAMKVSPMKSNDMMMADSDLTLGSVGDGVVTLQTTLVEKGFLTLPSGVAKGYFGNLTKAALKMYQASLGVKASGYFGPLTRAAMHSAMMMKGDSMKPAN